MGNIIVQKTAKRIHDIRKEKKLSGDDVAKRAGMHRATYYRYEGGDQKNMKIDKLQKIAEVLGVQIVDLIVWDEEKPILSEEDGFDDLDRELLRIIHPLSRESKLSLLAGLKSAQEVKE